MTTSQSSASGEVTAIDTTARGPLLRLVGFAIKWLIISGVLALISSIQLFQPSFFSDCQVFTHGRLQALQESVFLYGWAANAGLAIALWVLARLGGAPLRALNWVTMGTFFWNAGLLLGLVGIAIGDATGISFLQLPRYVQPLMLVSYGAIAIAGVLAWTGRRSEGTFASHWYAVAALFLFPWIFSAAQVMMLWVPVRGVLQAIAAGWYVQAVWTLWLAPLALAGAFYLVPKITGRVIPSYVFWTPLSFWTLVVVGPWTGGRNLVGGPVPAWIPTIAIVSCSLLLFHYFMTFLNLRRGFGAGGFALKFIVFGLVCYVFGGALDALTSIRGVARITQFTYFTEAQTTLALYGGASMMFLGAIYYFVPRVSGNVWASAALARGHYFLVALGVLALVVSLAGAGWVQGHDLNNSAVSFTAIAEHTKPWLLAATAAQGVLLLASVVLGANFLLTAVYARTAVPVSQLLRQPATMEAPAS